jgi:hypothetical protein
MVPSAEVEYYRKGSGAAANLEKGPANMLSFRGSKVFETRPFDIDFIGEPRDLLVRERQIGEFYEFPTAADVKDKDGAGDRDIYIYDMDSDDFEKISYAKCAEIAKAAFKRTMDLKDDIPDAAPGTVLLVRPFMTYNMASAILMKSGLETGFTAHGHHDFMLTDDVIHKVHIGHYTFYHKSVVKQPKNIVIAEDIFASSYVSGEGTGIFGDNGKLPDGSAKKDLIDDLTQQLGDARMTKDLIPIWIPQNDDGEQAKITNPLDLTGSYGPTILNDQNSDMENDQPHYPNATKITTKYQFDQLSAFTSDDRFLAPIRSLNTVCFRGHSLSYDPKTKTHSKITINTGHWGPNVYPGCRAVRNGENTFLKDMEYAKLRVASRLGLASA